MKVHLVYNDKGEVLAATLAGDNAEEFVPGDGEHVDDFDVPGDLTEDEFHRQFERFSVDVEGKSLKLNPPSAES